MVDEIFDRAYRESRSELNRSVEQVFSTIGRELGKSFKALHQFEWSAPWAARPAASNKDVGCA